MAILDTIVEQGRAGTEYAHQCTAVVLQLLDSINTLIVAAESVGADGTIEGARQMLQATEEAKMYLESAEAKLAEITDQANGLAGG